MELIGFYGASKIGAVTAASMGIPMAAAVALRYRSVRANQYMAKTGAFVKGVHVSRKTFQWPFQEIKVIDLSPINFHFLGSNMSKELVPFKLPVTFTVSPKHPERDLEGFINYATRLGDMNEDQVKNIIGGIVNGETRAFVGTMTIQEIFNDKEAFKKNVVDRVQKDLDQFGLEIHNANIEEMHDTEGNSYFENLKKKALESARTHSRIDVAEALKEGDIGEKQREIITRKEKAILEAEAVETETIQNQKMSNYNREYTITNTENDQRKEIAKIEAHKVTESRRIEIESDLFKQEQAKELERLRSEHIIKATAIGEEKIKISEAEANSIKISADATYYAENKKADAEYYAKCKQAEAIRAQLEATAQGLQRIYEVSNANPELANFYLALEKGVFDRDGLFSVIADKQALAIKDMNPKINIWSTGNDKGDFTGVISNLAKTVPPIFDAIQQQTNIKLPNFFSKNDYEKQ
ncbi:hypothetical protein H012_gp308 [Acanthamoeba polyphaga moumouvirus]|uniref:Band 7 domain-containing protein n=2 Tax=Moumouvirus TaxID=3080801 RepID=L7RD16_9VIRU|nr:hypothetical protein H012_gp308 [Acanthamoeba polyphaga moumouvirus]AEX62532.1 flotillin domain protein [Moumouvirus Monve]AGC02146.1 hypothetical protein Moumou_00622 [Acanthamoeba polyphaga moumouvirus]AQN68521.1 hypothetical protein [Saudi moumouvirus]